MKSSRVLVSIILALLGLPLPSRAGTREESALRVIGLKVVNAITQGDVAFIASITDPEGIFVGFDGVRHSADSFKSDLTRHVGLYCELFEKGCKTKHNAAYTLEHVFRSGPRPRISDLKFKTEGNTGTADYIEPVGGDLIATLSFRLAGGVWFLYDIHYV